MNEITVCPRCRRTISPKTAEVAGGNFCEHCNEPLFWRPRAVAQLEVPAGGVPNGVASTQGVDRLWPHSRLPEKHGIESDNYEGCWNCGERNHQPARGEEVTCRLCGVTIPRPIEPTPPRDDTGDCASPEGDTARRSWEVPDPLLLGLGVLLGLLTVILVFRLLFG